MLVAEQRRHGQRQMERRAKAARRSSRLIYPKTAARRLHQSRSAHKNQNPQNGHLMARFDWGLGAVCFGASPVAAVFGSAPGSATPPEHRIYFKPSSQAALLKQDISTLRGTGHFYFALTGEYADADHDRPYALEHAAGIHVGDGRRRSTAPRYTERGRAVRFCTASRVRASGPCGSPPRGCRKSSSWMPRRRSSEALCRPDAASPV
jgi:hypothetical protein